MILPSIQRLLQELGENIKLARLRRNISAEQMAERASISRATLWHIENGKETVALGHYVRVLMALGLEKDLLLIAKDDVLGQRLQDAGLLKIRKRSTKHTKTTS